MLHQNFLWSFGVSRYFKATSAYLSGITGKYSAAIVTTKVRIACPHKEASNSIVKSNHTSPTHSLKISSTIQFDGATGKGKHIQTTTLDEQATKQINNKLNEEIKLILSQVVLIVYCLFL